MIEMCIYEWGRAVIKFCFPMHWKIREGRLVGDEVSPTHFEQLGIYINTTGIKSIC